MLGLEGRAVLVTGGAMGIGRAIVRRFAQEGARVATVDLAERELHESSAALEAGGLGVLALTGDVTDEAAVTSAVDRAVAAFGGLDVLVNNVGFGLELGVEDTTPAQWRHVLDTCLGGCYLCSRAALPHLRSGTGPSIVHLSSIQGQLGYRRFAAYAAAKGAIIALTRQMAGDLGPDGIRVNAICPGSVMTPGAQIWLEEQPDPPRVFADMRRWPALRRLGDPEEIAAAVAWLASDQASYVTGHALVVDGGASVLGHDASPPEVP
jgi:NAD(P)-dependent dehydrogenase (short-subunit alcohol dehydrogenase family)